LKIVEVLKGIIYFFDRYLSNLNILIEIDGEQHFRPIQFEGITLEKAIEKFIIQQQNDQIKNEYCENKRIKLIRIRYDENIEKILKKELSLYDLT
jgi:hypothetical protein